MGSVYYPEVSANPLNTQIDKGAEIARAANCKLVIGLGGGSAIDAAKGMAIVLGHKRPIWDFCIGTDVQPITDKTYPIIAITTTSGTGSECTQWSVITNAKTEEKPGIGCDYTFAKVAIVDPELMATMPPKITASTGFDTLAHAIEAYTAVLETPITDLACEQAIRLVGRFLRRAVKNGQDREARNAMAYANSLAGIAISVGIVTVCHGLAHSIGGLSGSTHGETLATMTPETMRFSMRSHPDKFRKIAMFLRDECGGPGKLLAGGQHQGSAGPDQGHRAGRAAFPAGAEGEGHRAGGRRGDPLHGRLDHQRPRRAEAGGPDRHHPQGVLKAP